MPVLLLTALPEGCVVVPPEPFATEMFGIGLCFQLRHSDTFALSDAVVDIAPAVLPRMGAEVEMGAHKDGGAVVELRHNNRLHYDNSGMAVCVTAAADVVTAGVIVCEQQLRQTILAQHACDHGVKRVCVLIRVY